MSQPAASKFFLPLLAAALSLTGCQSASGPDSGSAHPDSPSLTKRANAEGQTRSISNPGFGAATNSGLAANPLYQGELTETDLFGAGPRPAENSGENPAPRAARPKRGDKVVLIQSGAAAPDEIMLSEAAHFFSAATFSGLPPAAGSNLAEILRQKSVQGGFGFVVCYWGVLDFAPAPVQMHTNRLEPIPAPAMPEQKQQMCIRLTALILEVSTGEWTRITPQPYYVTRYSSGFSLKASDQELVRSLKVEGYRSLLADLVKE